MRRTWKQGVLEDVSEVDSEEDECQEGSSMAQRRDERVVVGPWNWRRMLAAVPLVLLFAAIVWTRYGELLLLREVDTTQPYMTVPITGNFDGRRHFGRDASFALRYDADPNRARTPDDQLKRQTTPEEEKDTATCRTYNTQGVTRGYRYCVGWSGTDGKSACNSSCVGPSCYKILNNARPSDRSQRPVLPGQETYDVTLAVHGVVGDLSLIKTAFAHWRGPKVAVLYAPGEPGTNEFEGIANEVARHVRAAASPLRDAHIVAFHGGARSAHVPTSALRNLAVDLATTEFVLPIDAGVVPSTDAYAVLSSLLPQMATHGPRVAFIVATFQSQPCMGASGSPVTSSHVKALSTDGSNGDLHLFPLTQTGLRELWLGGRVRPPRCGTPSAEWATITRTAAVTNDDVATVRQNMEQCGNVAAATCAPRGVAIEYAKWAGRAFGTIPLPNKTPSVVHVPTPLVEAAPWGIVNEGYTVLNVYANKYRIPRFNERLAESASLERAAQVAAMVREGFHFYTVDKAFLVKVHDPTTRERSEAHGREMQVEYDAYVGGLVGRVADDKAFATS